MFETTNAATKVTAEFRPLTAEEIGLVAGGRSASGTFTAGTLTGSYAINAPAFRWGNATYSSVAISGTIGTASVSAGVAVITDTLTHQSTVYGYNGNQSFGPYPV